MLLNDYNYFLPYELIAQEPLEKRDNSRLMVVQRYTNNLEHRHFFEIVDFLNADDLLVFNNTRVIALRLFGQKPTGGKVEVLLLNRLKDGFYSAIVSPGRRLQIGTRVNFDNGLVGEIVDRDEIGERIIRFHCEDNDPDKLIEAQGSVPLPPYIRKKLDDPQRYQTVYAQYDGSAAAPTAGLHFTKDLLAKIKAKGIRTAFVTLHVGLGTFRPIRAEVIEDHDMHEENYEISKSCADAIANTKGRIVCVGTTTCRALESAAIGKRVILPQKASTSLFITPGYEFMVVDCLITNFHTPKSSLLLMVSALAGQQVIRNAYQEAINDKYRFFSFGDAMFII